MRILVFVVCCYLNLLTSVSAQGLAVDCSEPFVSKHFEPASGTPTGPELPTSATAVIAAPINDRILDLIIKGYRVIAGSCTRTDQALTDKSGFLRAKDLDASLLSGPKGALLKEILRRTPDAKIGYRCNYDNKPKDPTHVVVTVTYCAVVCERCVEQSEKD